ncbi:serine/threonine protein phosphatase [Fusibacter sp. JL298sf-3]
MFTMKRLLSAYDGAHRVTFDPNSKFIFFSDVHRGDNSLSDEFAHNQNLYYYALQHYYKEGFTYIEVGDGDELWEHSKFEVIRYAHSDVYMLLRKFFDDNRFIMLYGNHNAAFKKPNYIEKNLFHFYDEYESFFNVLFPGIEVYESVVLEEAGTGSEIFVVHGHQGDFINDQIWPIMKFLNRHFWRYFHIIGLKNPASPAKNAHKRHKIEKNYSKFIRQYKKMLIVGHTHRPKYPRDNELPYFNTGCCIHPRNITGLEIENGAISFIEWRIVPDEDGRLKIRRRVIRGPKPLTQFMYPVDKKGASNGIPTTP